MQVALAGAIAATALPSSAVDLAWHGDLGASVVRTQASAPCARARSAALPYAWGVLGTAFVREDTFGIGVLPVGWGALELAGRISTEGSDADGPGLAHRRNPRPIGVGTFQETPWGGVFLNAFHDPVSHGSLLEAAYAGELVLGPVALYPQLGVARRSARYVDHLHGATGSAADGARASTVPVFALAGEWAVAGPWVLAANVRREVFDGALRDCPRVAAGGRTTALLALARRFP
jgi:outer membrane protein